MADSPLLNDLRKRLRKYLKAHKQLDLAARSGVSQSRISVFVSEKEDSGGLSIRNVEALYRAIGCKIVPVPIARESKERRVPRKG